MAKGGFEDDPELQVVRAAQPFEAQVHRERADLQAQLGHAIPGGKLTSSQVRALIDALCDIVTVLAEADPQDKADLYGELGVNLTYHPEGRVSSE